MNLQWLASPEWTNIVKTLLHTLWQGALIAVLLGCGLRWLKNPVVRYRCSLAALSGVLLAGLVTWAILTRPAVPIISQSPVMDKTSAPIPALNESSILVVNFPLVAPEAESLRWTAWLALLWLAGATVMIGRAAFQVAGAERLRRSTRPLNDPHIHELLDNARQTIGLVRRVRIAVTDQLASPAVVGVLVPTLILPLSLTTALTPVQIRFVLLHELAHIQRGDYLAGLFQLFVEAMLFFNPAVWWISRQMRIEREVCCDTLAVTLSGAPVDYARTLVHVAENVLNTTPTLASSFSGQRGSSSLKDRVQRMLVPGYRPALRLTWRTMLLALLTGSGLLFLSALGTRATVAAILSPEQRMDRIEKKMAELGEKPAVDYDNAGEKAPQVRISGAIRAADGSVLPQWVYLNVNSKLRVASYGTSVLARNGYFTNSIQAGNIYLSAEVTNFAPAFIGPLDGIATDRLENLELVLQRGFAVPVQIVDADDGKPVTQAEVVTMFWINNSGFQNHLWKSDTNGSLTLTHCADLPMDFIAKAPGYEIFHKKITQLKADEPLRITMRHGLAISGVVLDRATSRPIVDATIRILYQSGALEPQQFGWEDTVHVLGRTDAQGGFSFNQFASGGRYYLGVSAPGHESVILKNIMAGQSNLTANLGPELIVRGHVLGNLESLQKIDSAPALSSSVSEVYGDNSYGNSSWVPLQVVNEVATFQFTNRVAGLVTLTTSNGGKVEREVSAPVNDWVIDLGQIQTTESQSLPKRQVVFRFHHPSGVPPRGTVQVQIPDDLNINHRTAHFQTMEITNWEVRVPIAIGGQTTIEAERMVGYWFDRAGENGRLFSIEVTNGTGPLVIDIPLISAGAIYAKARNADGSPAGDVLFGVSELKRAAGLSASALMGGGNDTVSDAAPRQWISAPLPLGGTYQIYAWRDNSFCVSQPVELTESNPDAAVELQFAPGKKFIGEVLGADGKPMPETELKASFTLSTPDKHGFGLKSIYTDGQGLFELTDATPDTGEYSLEVSAPGMMAVRVPLDFRLQPQKIQLKPGRTLAGLVVQAGTGYPIPGMEVRALDYDSNKLPMLTTHTDADGRFAFTTLGDVSYTLYPDGGELIARPPVSGNPKFRADGRTNLVLTVKLYPWSNLKPAVPLEKLEAKAVEVTTNLGILNNPKFTAALQQLKQRSGANSLPEPEQVRSLQSGDHINALDPSALATMRKMLADTQLPIQTNALSPSNSTSTGSAVLGREAIVSILHQVRLKDIKLDHAPLSVALNVLANAILTNNPARLTVPFVAAPILDTNTITLAMTDVLAEDVLDAFIMVASHPPGQSLKYSIQNQGVEFSWKNQIEPMLYQRAYQIDPETFPSTLRSLLKLNTNGMRSVTAEAKSYFATLGIDWDSPKGKAIFYNDHLGIFFAKATLADLDKIDHTILALNQRVPLVSLKTKFLQLPNGTWNQIKEELAKSKASVQTNQFGGVAMVLSAENFKKLLATLQSKSGVKTLAEPEATTASGRQMLMLAGEKFGVITNFSLQVTATNPTPVVIPQVSTMQTGATLNAVPRVRVDQNTVNLTTIASLTEFLGYNDSGKTRRVSTPTGEWVKLPVASPSVQIYQAFAGVNLSAGQTLMLQGIVPAVNDNDSTISEAAQEFQNQTKQMFPRQSKADWETARKYQTSAKPKKELLIFVTATIIDPPDKAHQDSELTSQVDRIWPWHMTM